jgi:hypothetical protein
VSFAVTGGAERLAVADGAELLAVARGGGASESGGASEV